MLGEVRPAEGDQLVALEPSDDRRARAVRSPQPEAELADEREPLWVAELRPVSELVLDHPPQNATRPRTAGQRVRRSDLDVVGAVEPAGESTLGAPWRRACLHAASAGSMGRQGRERPRPGGQELRPVAVPRERPGTPRNDRLRRGANGRLASEGDVGAHEPGGSAGISSGMGSTGCGPGSGIGSLRFGQRDRGGLDLDDPLGRADVHRETSLASVGGRTLPSQRSVPDLFRTRDPKGPVQAESEPVIPLGPLK